MRSIAIVVVLGFVATATAQQTSGITVDKDKKLVIIDAKVAPRKLPKLDQVYPIEVIACWPSPKGQKAHETVVTIDVLPSDVHKALESLGLKAGKPVKGGEDLAGMGPELKIYIEVTEEGGTKRVGMDKVLHASSTKAPFPKSVTFRFTGSVMTKPDPNKDEMKYGADLTGTLISVFPVTDETVCQSSLTMKQEKLMKLDVNAAALPKEGTPVKLVLEVIAK